jgi:hypothetical protein
MPASSTDVTKSRFSYWRGYPERYRGLLREEGKRAAVAVAVLVLLPGGGALAWFLGSAWLPLRLVLGLLLLGIAGFGAFLCARTIRALVFPKIVPYFEKSLAESQPFAGGTALARQNQRLDELALAAGVTPLSSYGFNDDFAGQTVTWHEPALALATIRAILPKVSQDESRLRGDLELLTEWLNRAAARRIRFALLLRTTHSVADAEKEKRLGSLV